MAKSNAGTGQSRATLCEKNSRARHKKRAQSSNSSSSATIVSNCTAPSLSSPRVTHSTVVKNLSGKLVTQSSKPLAKSGAWLASRAANKTKPLPRSLAYPTIHRVTFTLNRNTGLIPPGFVVWIGRLAKHSHRPAFAEIAGGTLIQLSIKDPGGPAHRGPASRHARRASN